MRNAVSEGERINVSRIANELIELYQLQMDTLDRDPSEADDEDYLARRRRINELRGDLELVPRHSGPA
jgi:hypothetical protein